MATGRRQIFVGLDFRSMRLFGEITCLERGKVEIGMKETFLPTTRRQLAVSSADDTCSTLGCCAR